VTSDPSGERWGLGQNFPDPSNRLKIQIRQKVLLQPDAREDSDRCPHIPDSPKQNACLMASSTGISAKTSAMGTFRKASIAYRNPKGNSSFVSRDISSFLSINSQTNSRSNPPATSSPSAAAVTSLQAGSIFRSAAKPG